MVLKHLILPEEHFKANLFFPFMTPHPPNPVKIYLYNLTKVNIALFNSTLSSMAYQIPWLLWGEASEGPP